MYLKDRCGPGRSHLALLISAELPAVFTSGPPHSSVLKAGVNPSLSARLPFISHDSVPTPQRQPLSAKPCDRAGGDSESPVRQPGAAFLNKNMHNSATEELCLEIADGELRLPRRRLVLYYQLTRC